MNWMVVYLPFEKYKSQLGWLFSIYGKNHPKVPNHQEMKPTPCLSRKGHPARQLRGKNVFDKHGPSTVPAALLSPFSLPRSQSRSRPRCMFPSACREISTPSRAPHRHTPQKKKQWEKTEQPNPSNIVTCGKKKHEHLVKTINKRRWSWKNHQMDPSDILQHH